MTAAPVHDRSETSTKGGFVREMFASIAPRYDAPIAC